VVFRCVKGRRRLRRSAKADWRTSLTAQRSYADVAKPPAGDHVTHKCYGDDKNFTAPYSASGQEGGFRPAASGTFAFLFPAARPPSGFYRMVQRDPRGQWRPRGSCAFGCTSRG
jgi:hypothetical protein